MLYLLNSPVLSSWGIFSFQPLSFEEAKSLLVGTSFVSAIGHESTAEVLSTLLSISVPVNRVQVKMIPGDMAVIFRLKTRCPEGKILSAEEIQAIGYEFGLMVMKNSRRNPVRPDYLSRLK